MAGVNAIQALSQLSYGPESGDILTEFRRMVKPINEIMFAGLT